MTADGVPMRALTVRQPWSWAIAHAGKNIENRVGNFRYRGPLAIHAGLAWAGAGGVDTRVLEAFRPYLTRHQAERAYAGIDPAEHRDRLVFGAIVAVAELVDCHPAAGCCGPWGEPDGVYHLVLADVRQLDEPVPYRGAQGLWKVPLDVARLVDREARAC